MIRTGFPSDGLQLLVGDASMWISLAATGFADACLRALSCRTVITDLALGELDRGRAKGRGTADSVLDLINAGLVEVVRLESADEPLFLSLVSGGASETLDDGEAATLAWAAGHTGFAVIDERKATLVAARRTPTTQLMTTTDLLLAPQIAHALGGDAIASAFYAALVHARMRVPPNRLNEVVALIGNEKAGDCCSLPAAVRGRSAKLTQNLDLGLELQAEK